MDFDYLRKMFSFEQSDTPAFLELLNAHLALLNPRPIAEYHEDMGPVLWWRFPIEEPPYCGTPNDIGMTINIETRITLPDGSMQPSSVRNFDVGGWPGSHTHFTPIPIPRTPTCAGADG